MFSGASMTMGSSRKFRLTNDQYAAQITSKGNLELRQRPPRSDKSKRSPRETIPIKVVPKGLRSYDKDDAEFFLDLLPPSRRATGSPRSSISGKLASKSQNPTRRSGLV